MKLPHTITRKVLPEDAVWHDNVDMLMRNDPVGGNEYGPINRPNQQLTDRTAYLKYNLEQLSDQVNTGFVLLSSFEQGSILTLANEVLLYEADGQYYRWTGDLPKDVPANSTPDSTGGFGGGKWILVGDGTLRQQLANNDGANLIGFDSLTLNQALSTLPNTFKNIYDVFIIYGQSNAVGEGGINKEFDINELVPIYQYSYYWNYIKKQVITLDSKMQHSSGNNSTGSAWNAFAKNYIEKTGRGIIFIPCASGGKSIAELAKGQNIYTYMSNSINNFKTFINSTSIKLGNTYCLFNQGETDMTNNTSKVDYQTALIKLTNDMISDFEIDAFYLIMVGTPLTRQQKFWQQIQLAQLYCSNSHNKIKLASRIPATFSRDNGGLGADGTHFTAKGYNLMGEDAAKNIADDVKNFTSPSSQSLSFNGIELLPQNASWHRFAAFLRPINGQWVILDKNNHPAGVATTSNMKSVIIKDGNLNISTNFSFTQALGLTATIDDVLLQRGWSITARISNDIIICATANMSGTINLKNKTISLSDSYLNDMFSLSFIEDSQGGYYQVDHPRSNSLMTFISIGTTTKGMIRSTQNNNSRCSFRVSDYNGEELGFNLQSAKIDLSKYLDANALIVVSGTAAI